MRIYDNAPDSRHDEMAGFFPSWYRNVLEMDALWQIWGAFLDQAQDDTERVLDNNFITRCDEQTIEEWEDFLDIKLRIPRSLENRRRFIMMHFSGFGKCSATKIKSVIKQYTGSDSTVQFLPTGDEQGNYELVIDMERGNVDTLYVGDVQIVLDKIIPAHILHTLQTIRHANIEVNTHITRYKYTYSQTGVRPETATLGTGIELIETYKTEHGEFIYEYPQTNQSSVTGVHPEIATLGKEFELTATFNSQIRPFITEFAQASENAASGVIPESLQLE